MKKIITIDNMNCKHCQAKIEGALQVLNPQKIKTNLAKKTVKIYLAEDVADEKIKGIIEKEDFTVSKIEIAKGLF